MKCLTIALLAGAVGVASLLNPPAVLAETSDVKASNQSITVNGRSIEDRAFEFSKNVSKIENMLNGKENYDKILHDIEINEFKKIYHSATAERKKEVVNEARNYIFDKLVNKIFPVWYGTQWEFYGTTRTPKEGSIACGYFVTTTLEDAGFKVPRVKMAQQPSENIIKSLVSEKDIKRFHNAPVEDVIKYVQKSGKGLYMVGLDIHVGFIVNDGKNIKFVHSSYYKSQMKVVSEDLDTKNPLKDSKYRVVGKLLDDRMMESWINGAVLPLKFDYSKTN